MLKSLYWISVSVLACFLSLSFSALMSLYNKPSLTFVIQQETTVFFLDTLKNELNQLN